MDERPYAVRTILQSLGAGPFGGIVYCGGHDLVYRHPDRDRDMECRPSYPSRVTPEGMMEFDVGVAIKVNGKTRQAWTIFITYEADDTYTVRLWRKAPLKSALFGIILDSKTDVYWDDLQSVVENMYDGAIKKYNGGFIPC